MRERQGYSKRDVRLKEMRVDDAGVCLLFAITYITLLRLAREELDENSVEDHHILTLHQCNAW